MTVPAPADVQNRVESIFHQVRGIDVAAKRTAALDRLCAQNAELRARVEALLRAEVAAPSFFASADMGQHTTLGSPLLQGAQADLGGESYKTLLQKLNDGILAAAPDVEISIRCALADRCQPILVEHFEYVPDRNTLLEGALEISKRHFGLGSPETRRVLRLLGEAYVQAQSIEADGKAQQTYAEWLTAKKSFGQPDAPEDIEALLEYAGVLSPLFGRVPEARADNARRRYSAAGQEPPGPSQETERVLQEAVRIERKFWTPQAVGLAGNQRRRNAFETYAKYLLDVEGRKPDYDQFMLDTAEFLVREGKQDPCWASDWLNADFMNRRRQSNREVAERVARLNLELCERELPPDPRHAVTEGKTPALDPHDARRLMDSIGGARPIDLRGRTQRVPSPVACFNSRSAVAPSG